MSKDSSSNTGDDDKLEVFAQRADNQCRELEIVTLQLQVIALKLLCKKQIDIAIQDGCTDLQVAQLSYHYTRQMTELQREIETKDDYLIIYP